MKRVILFVALSLAGCTGRIDAPSLLPRPIEANRPDDVAAPAPPPVDPAQAAIIAKLVEQARAADAAFEKALSAAMGGGAVGTEAWIAAESARSAAEVARGPAVDVLTQLDTAISKATDQGLDPSALIAARTDVQAIVDRQAERLSALNR